MNDITAIAVFLGCLAVTLALVKVCECLAPQGSAPEATDTRHSESQR